MLDFSPEKMLFIFLIVLIVLGPEKLPEVSRKLGRAVGELRRLSGGFRDEMNKAVGEMTADPPSGDGDSAGSSSGTPTAPQSSGSSDDSSGA